MSRALLIALLALVAAGVSWAQPPAGEIPADTRNLAGGEACDPILPALAGAGGNGFAAAWIDGRIHGTVFGRHAERLAPETVRGTPGQRPTDPHLAVAPSGRIAVGWLEDDGPHVQILDPDGRPVTGDLALGGPAPGYHPDPQAEYEIPQVFDLVTDPAGGFVALWTALDTHGAHVGEDGRIQRFDPPAEGGFVLSQAGFKAVLHPDGHLWWIDHLDPPIDPPISLVRVLRARLDGPGAFEAEELFSDGRPILRRKAIAVDGQGRVVVAWNQSGGVFARRFAASGEPEGDPVTVAIEHLEASPREWLYSLDLATDAEGNFAVVWGRLLFEPSGFAVSGSALFVRSFGADGSPLGPAREVVSVPFVRLLSPRVAVSGPGELTVAWWIETIPPLLPPPCSLSETIFARRLPLAGEGTLLLGDGRFRVEVAWQDQFNGGTGVGYAIPDTADSGGFWFFDPDNTELKVKVIDGRTVNGRFWFFYGALSNVGYQITVTDQRSGRTRTYDNPPGRLASFADTSAFPVP